MILEFLNTLYLKDDCQVGIFANFIETIITVLDCVTSRETGINTANSLRFSSRVLSEAA